MMNEDKPNQIVHHDQSGFDASIHGTLSIDHPGMLLREEGQENLVYLQVIPFQDAVSVNSRELVVSARQTWQIGSIG